MLVRVVKMTCKEKYIIKIFKYEINKKTVKKIFLIIIKKNIND